MSLNPRALGGVALLLGVSCSSLDKNVVAHGQLPLRGGMSHEGRWSDPMNFKRVSWFSGATLLFDFLYSEAQEGSPFYAWFSKFEQEQVSRCQRPLVVMTYFLDSQKYSARQFYASLEGQGAMVSEIPGFESFLRPHPDFDEFSLRLYDVKLLCCQGPGGLMARVPSFPPVTF